jgi:hypothetical protein
VSQLVKLKFIAKICLPEKLKHFIAFLSEIRITWFWLSLA